MVHLAVSARTIGRFEETHSMGTASSPGVLLPLHETGALPVGVHSATYQEVDERFGRGSELRRVQMESVRWMLDLAVRARAERVVLNGSFVTDTIEPNDVDCALLVTPGSSRDAKAFKKLRSGLPFVDIAIVFQGEFDKMVSKVFASDRYGAPKGMVEVLI